MQEQLTNDDLTSVDADTLHITTILLKNSMTEEEEDAGNKYEVCGLSSLIEFFWQHDTVTNFYVMLPLIFIGFISNLLIVIVLRRDKTMNRTTRFLLQMLALSDVMFYVLRPLIDVMELFSKHMEWSEVYFTLDSLLSASQTITAWMTVIVTYQRYVAISRPLHAHQYVTMSRARAAVAVVWISSIIIYSPFCCLELIFYENWELIRCVYYVIIIVTVFAFPMSMTVLFNIRLIVVTRKSIAFVRQNLPRGFTYTDNSDNRIASSRLRVSVTLIVIVIVYLVGQLPMTAVEILTVIVHSGLIDPSFCDYHWFRLSLLIAYNTSLCLIVVNSLADCVTYCIMGKRFRQSLLRKLNNVKTIKRRLGIQDKQPRA